MVWMSCRRKQSGAQSQGRGADRPRSLPPGAPPQWDPSELGQDRRVHLPLPRARTPSRPPACLPAWKAPSGLPRSFTGGSVKGKGRAPAAEALRSHQAGTAPPPPASSAWAAWPQCWCRSPTLPPPCCRFPPIQPSSTQCEAVCLKRSRAKCPWMPCGWESVHLCMSSAHRPPCPASAFAAALPHPDRHTFLGSRIPVAPQCPLPTTSQLIPFLSPSLQIKWLALQEAEGDSCSPLH